MLPLSLHQIQKFDFADTLMNSGFLRNLHNRYEIKNRGLDRMITVLP
jgi:hypothetical protein